MHTVTEKYSYELQVSEAAQQRGIGKMLVQMLVDVGTKWGMAKIMLTVLKSNVRARRFYQSAGWGGFCLSMKAPLLNTFLSGS